MPATMSLYVDLNCCLRTAQYLLTSDPLLFVFFLKPLAIIYLVVEM